eukprot:CAMPEP_0177701232 /NCGR_PEP_ID=MMETSP0484_2-20121128/6507_1 /TAXON_ID=354590 /ORGANISM="Rhodomonas lens, Strain RHODO" /LENGTH=142 /DNA_ID=CAMNT_0019212463 /DNA_START=286 /DNA_END=711 /DNA_ORIENTATION=-
MPYSGLLEPRGGSKVTLKLGGTVPDTRAPPRRARLQVGLRCWLLGCGRGGWLTPGAGRHYNRQPTLALLQASSSEVEAGGGSEAEFERERLPADLLGSDTAALELDLGHHHVFALLGVSALLLAASLSGRGLGACAVDRHHS